MWLFETTKGGYRFLQHLVVRSWTARIRPFTETSAESGNLRRPLLALPTQRHIFCLLCRLQKIAFVCLSVTTEIRFESALVASVVLLFCSLTSVRPSLCIRFHFPPPVWSAYFPYISTSHGVLVPRCHGFHRVLFPSPYALGGNIEASRVVVAVFVRHEVFPFCCRLSCILVYSFFQDSHRCALVSASDAFKLSLTCRGSMLSTIGVPLIAPAGPT